MKYLLMLLLSSQVLLAASAINFKSPRDIDLPESTRAGRVDDVCSNWPKYKSELKDLFKAWMELKADKAPMDALPFLELIDKLEIKMDADKRKQIDDAKAAQDLEIKRAQNENAARGATVSIGDDKL